MGENSRILRDRWVSNPLLRKKRLYKFGRCPGNAGALLFARIGIIGPVYHISMSGKLSGFSEHTAEVDLCRVLLYMYSVILHGKMTKMNANYIPRPVYSERILNTSGIARDAKVPRASVNNYTAILEGELFD